MATNVTIRSKGRFCDTDVFMQEQDGKDPGHAIAGGDLQKLQLYYEPGVQQVAIEIKYVKDGSIVRWNGANEGDRLGFHMQAMADGACYDILASATELTVKVGPDPDHLLPVFLAATTVIEVVANGWALQTNKYFDMMPKGASA